MTFFNSNHFQMIEFLQKHHEKASLFNIDDEEEEEFGLELTHKGESLQQIEKFERPVDNDEDSDNEGGNLEGWSSTQL